MHSNKEFLIIFITTWQADSDDNNIKEVLIFKQEGRMRTNYMPLEEGATLESLSTLLKSRKQIF